jgi:hypothetical protein
MTFYFIDGILGTFLVWHEVCKNMDFAVEDT